MRSWRETLRRLWKEAIRFLLPSVILKEQLGYLQDSYMRLAERHERKVEAFKELESRYECRLQELRSEKTKALRLRDELESVRHELRFHLDQLDRIGVILTEPCKTTN